MLDSHYYHSASRVLHNGKALYNIPSAKTAGADNTSHISIALFHSCFMLCEEHNGFDMQSFKSSHAELSITQYTCYHITLTFQCDSLYHCVLYITNTPALASTIRGFISRGSALTTFVVFAMQLCAQNASLYYQ
jgi:hypothetical protein